MAITNAQQYQQLVNPPMKGRKRPGYRGDDAAKADRARSGGQNTSRADERGGVDRSRTTKEQDANQRNVVREGRIREVEKLINRPTVREKINKGLTNFRNRNIKKFIDNSIRKDLYRSGFVPNAFKGINIPTTLGIAAETGYSMFGPEVDLFDKDSLREIASTLTNTGGSLTKSQSKALESFGKNIANRDEFLEEGMTQKRFEELYPKPTVDDRDGPQDPCRGPNPPAYCFTGIRSAAPVVEEEEPEYVNPLSLLSPRIAGSQFAAEGGRIGLRGGDAARSDAASGRNAGRADPGGGVERGGGGDGPKGPPSVINKPPKTKPSFLKKQLADVQALGTIPFNFAKALFGNPFNKKGNFLTKATITKEMEDYLEKVASEKGTLSGSITNTDYNMPTNTFELNKFMSPMQIANATTFGQGSFTTDSTTGKKDFDGGMYDMDGKFGSVGDFIDAGGLMGAADKFGQNLYEDQVNNPDMNYLAGGGIASLDDMDREGLFLGGLAKGLKKAVRGVKKLAKSPIGKAALLASPFLLKKGLFSSLIGQKAMTQAPFAEGTGLMGLDLLLLIHHKV